MKVLRSEALAFPMILISAFLLSRPIPAQENPEEALLKQMTFWNLGPFRAGSWVTSLAVPYSRARARLYRL